MHFSALWDGKQDYDYEYSVEFLNPGLEHVPSYEKRLG